MLTMYHQRDTECSYFTVTWLSSVRLCIPGAATLAAFGAHTAHGTARALVHNDDIWVLRQCKKYSLSKLSAFTYLSVTSVATLVKVKCD